MIGCILCVYIYYTEAWVYINLRRDIIYTYRIEPQMRLMAYIIQLGIINQGKCTHRLRPKQSSMFFTHTQVQFKWYIIHVCIYSTKIQPIMRCVFCVPALIVVVFVIFRQCGYLNCI